MTYEASGTSFSHDAAEIVVEVTSPSTANLDKHNKLPFYLSCPTLREIWYIDSLRRLVQVWFRRVDRWDGSILIGKASFHSEVLGVDVPLEDVYRFTSL